MKSILTWVSLCFLGIYMIGVCSAALSTSGTQEMDEFGTQGQQALASSGGRSSPFPANRVSNRAIRGPQLNVPASRTNLQQKSASTSKSTSTSSPSQEQEGENDKETEQDAEGEAEADQEEEQSSSTSSTTEAPRKKLGFSVRPFRSQQDLIESLKRRRQMIQQHGYTISTAIPTSTTEKIQSKSTVSTRKNLSKNSAQATELHGVQKKLTTSGRRPYVKPTLSTTTTAIPSSNDAITEETNVVSQPARSSRTYPKTRRTST